MYDQAFLAKSAAGLDQISGGRFVLGLATGWRDEDYRVAGKEYAGRGKRLDEMIEYMQRAWRGELVEGATKGLTPTPTDGETVPLAIGGHTAVSVTRAVKYGIGWTAGGAAPDDVKALSVPVLGHRIILAPGAHLREMDESTVMQELLEKVIIPGGSYEPR